MEIIRAFIALEIPNEIKSKISMAIPEIAGIRKVGEDQIHVTLAFLGGVDTAKIDGLARRLSTISENEFGIRIAGLGMMAAGNHGIVFAKIVEGIKELTLLHNEVWEKAVSLGIKRERRGFLPHITIARVKDTKQAGRAVEESIAANRETAFGEFVCNKLFLKKSVLTGNGPTYTELFEKRFG